MERIKEYRLYLKTKAWKDKRALVIKRDNGKCQKCGNTKFLQVHHLTYKNIYNEKLTDLITLCRKCHSKEHEKYRKKEEPKKSKIDSRDNVISLYTLNKYKKYLKSQLDLGLIDIDYFREEMLWISSKRPLYENKNKKKKKQTRIKKRYFRYREKRK